MTIHLRRRAAFLSLLLLPLLSGCLSPTEGSADTVDLQQARSRWQRANLRSYSFNSGVICFCPREYTRTATVTVVNGVVSAVVDAATGESRPLDWRRSVDSLFAMVAVEVQQRPERLQVTYDPVLGYPTSLTYGTPENDGGGYITTSDLRPRP